MTDTFDIPALTGRIQTFVRDEALWQAGASLLVAVSGGADSLALLELLREGFAGETLAVAHVNHLLRREAEEEAEFVAARAAAYRIPYLYRRVDVLARVAETGESVETAARELRYAALREMAQEAGATHIATGHTANDQAETVLMRLLRGAGPAGLAGIPPKRDNIVRPLLPVWRWEILAFLEARGLAFRTDLSNYSTDFLRNRVRLELLPLLEAEYAPRLQERLVHLADLQRQDQEVLVGQADDFFRSLSERQPDGVALPVLEDESLSLRRRLWRRAIVEVCGMLDDISYAHLEEIRRLPPGQQVHLPGVRVLHEAGRLVFLPAPREGKEEVGIPDTMPVIPGKLCFPTAACCLHLAESAGRLPIEHGDTAVLDARAVRGVLCVRSWRPGDRYRPLGAPGARKLQDIFTDARVPRRLRTRVPLLLDEEGIIWLAGFRIAERVKITPATVCSLRIHIEWELNPWTLALSNAG